MESELEERLRGHSAYFLTLASLIPAQYLAASRDGENETTDKRPAKKSMETRFWHNKKDKAKPTVKSRGRSAAAGDQDASKEAEPARKGRRGRQFNVEHVRSTSLQDLRLRLQQKMREASGGRKASVGDESEGHQRKRKRRGEAGEEGAAKKERRLEEKKKRKESVKKLRETKQKKAALAVAVDPEERKPGSAPQFTFNRFDFNQSSEKTAKKKDYNRLITKAEAKQNKLQQLVEEDKERGGEVQEKVKWSKAVRMARGEKMRDDPALLKKTVKRLEKKKESHRKKWGERVKEEQQRGEARDKKRQKNIRDRVDKIKAKKNRLRAKKRGH